MVPRDLGPGVVYRVRRRVGVHDLRGAASVARSQDHQCGGLQNQSWLEDLLRSR